MAVGEITRKMRQYKEIEQKLQRYREKSRPLVDQLKKLEQEIYGRDRRLTTSFASQGIRQRVNE
jgi:hypothetical protein